MHREEKKKQIRGIIRIIFCFLFFFFLSLALIHFHAFSFPFLIPFLIFCLYPKLERS